LENGRYVYDLGPLNVGEKKEIKFILQVNDSFPTGKDKIINEVEVKDDGTETATTDNIASDDTPVLISAPVLVTEPAPTPIPAIAPILITEPTPQAVPDLPFTGGAAAAEVIAMCLGLSLASAGILLKRK
jgi:hypothetical protein